MHKVEFYVPLQDAPKVKNAVFTAGGGRIGAYDFCSWECLGQGQFRPGSGSRPTIGTHRQLERLEELKVELVVEDHLLKPVLEALVEAHPYEEPAYAAWPILTLADLEERH